MTEEASQSMLTLIEEQIDLQGKMELLLHKEVLTQSDISHINSFLSLDQQNTLRVMGKLGFQDLVQQNLKKIGQSIQIVENKLLEVLMLSIGNGERERKVKEKNFWESLQGQGGRPHSSAAHG